MQWVLLTAYAGYAVLSAVIHLAHRDVRRALYVAVPMLIAAAVVALASEVPAERVVWILAAGVLLALGARTRERS